MTTCHSSPALSHLTRLQRQDNDDDAHGKRKKVRVTPIRPPLQATTSSHVARASSRTGKNATTTATTAAGPAPAPGGAAAGGRDHGQCLGQEKIGGVVGYVNLNEKLTDAYTCPLDGSGLFYSPCICLEKECRWFESKSVVALSFLSPRSCPSIHPTLAQLEASLLPLSPLQLLIIPYAGLVALLSLCS